MRQNQSEEILIATVELFNPLQQNIKTITADNGKEFSQHCQIASALDIDCYFADPYSSWQRGSIENKMD